MTEPQRGVRLVRVDEQNWRVYRAVRLEMLLDAPRAFGATHTQVAARTDADWLHRLRGGPLWLALDGSATGARPSDVLGSVGMYWPVEQVTAQACLIGMWVRPSARGTGIGEALVAAVLDEATVRGVRRLTLEVATENRPAQALYRRLGFAPTGRSGSLPHDPTITEVELAVDVRRP